MRSIRWIEWLARDLRYAARGLRASPTFASVAVLTLAIGVAATTAIFSTTNAALLRPLPFPRADELISVRTRMIDGRVTAGGLSPVEIGALNEPQMPVVHAAGISLNPFEATMIANDGSRVEVVLAGVTDGFFEVLGLPMTVGRGFSHQDFVPSGPNAPIAIVLSHRTWTAMFGRDPGVVGRSLRFGEVYGSTTIVGVAGPEIDLPHGTDFWYAMRINPRGTGHGFATVLRMRPGTRIERLRSAGAAAMANLARTFPADADSGREYVMQPLLASIVGDLGPMLLIVLGATALLLLLGCVNVANLLLARGIGRTRDTAVRAALGASRPRLVSHLLADSLVLATFGALAGVGLAYVAVRLLLALGASRLPRLDTVPFDLRVAVFGVAALVFSALAMGLAPALRLAGVDIRGLLNETGRGATTSRGTSRLISALVVAEIALAIVLTAGAGWLVQSFERLGGVDPGFATSGRLVLHLRPGQRFSSSATALAWSHSMLARLRAAPGVVYAGAAATFPLRADRDGTGYVAVEGDPPPDPERQFSVHTRVVTSGFFEAMGIKVVSGRTFTDDDRAGTRPVAVVNRAFVRTFIGARDPRAIEFRYGYPDIDPNSLHAVIGVVDDVRYKSLRDAPDPAFYLVEQQLPFGFVPPEVVIASRGGDPQGLVPGLRNALSAFDSRADADFDTVADVVAATLTRQKLGMTLMLIFGALALVLAAIGIYGVIAYAAEQGRDEIATRIALGASTGRVFWLVMSAGQRLAILGIVAGLAGAYVGGTEVASLVYEMRAADPLVLVSAAVMVAAVTFVATMIPAVRASRLDPVRALRN